MNSLTQQGMAALRSGDKIQARQLLQTATENDPQDVTAWIWLAATVDDNNFATHCLEQALALDPNNLSAQKGLARLKSSSIQLSASQEPISQPISPFTSDTSSRPDSSQKATYPKQAPERTSAAKNVNTRPFTSLENEKTATQNIPDRKHKKKTSPWIWLGIGGIAFLVLLSCVLIFIILRSLTAPAPLISARNRNLSQPTLSPTPSATHTPIPSPTVTSTPTPRPTKTSTPTPTFPVLGGTIESQMDRIQQEVSDLRGLPITKQVPHFIVSAPVASQLLRNELVDDAYKADLQTQLRAMSALGLIKPSYDLINNALNHIVDGIGGFYEPWSKRIFVLGISFRGMEHFVYSHEFDHALVDMNYDMEEMGVGKDCKHDWQECQAIDALIEGDATFTMYQWLEQYAGPQDYQDLINYHPPAFALPEQSPPPYVSQDARFPYDYGSRFIKYLYDRGRWAEVNKAYKNLPASTEQILHPKKYLAGELPINMIAPDLIPALGDGWKLIKNESMGEWMTYLLLGYGADVAAQVPDDEALEAAAGWGGDRFQVYDNASTDATALAAEWVWDTNNDANQFHKALRYSLNERFRGAKLEHWAGECWEVNNQATCFFPKSDRTLWILAPTLELVDFMLIQYQGYP